jgi:hypothetical protein
MRTRYKLRRRELWFYWTSRMIGGFAVTCWFVVLIGIMIMGEERLRLHGAVLLSLGLIFGIPLTIWAWRRLREILGVWEGVVVDQEGIMVYGEFVSWDEAKEVR